MGQLIHLDDLRSRRARPVIDAAPAFFFDVSCPLSYLTAERVERTLGDVDWIAVDGSVQRRELSDAGLADLRARAQACARAWRLPLVWPDRFPGGARCALRAAAFACEIGVGAGFALAAGRLAFCGGFDLEDPETLAEAAAASGVPLDECLTAAGQTWRDAELEATAAVLRARGLGELPAIRVAERWLDGESGLLAVGALQHELRPLTTPLAPVG